jgi:hypothetical protein
MEPTIPLFEQAKLFRALDLTATMIGLSSIFVKDKPIKINKYLAFSYLVGEKSYLPELAS